MLVRTNTDYITLPTALLPLFKQHIRVLGSLEDESIMLYLTGAIDGISTYGDVDLFATEYEYQYVEAETGKPSGDKWYTGKVNLSNVILTDDVGTDLLNAVDNQRGYIYPAPLEGNICKFSTGYTNDIDMKPNEKTIVFRYAAHLYENREAINIGEPKFLPDWVNYAMASIWTPRT